MSGLRSLLERSRRPVLATLVGVGFVGAGLWITGGAARVSALVRTVVSAPQIDPFPGSRASTPRSVVVDGLPARVRRCTAPQGTSLGSLREYYDRIADRESNCGQGRILPHNSSVQENVAFVLWTSPQDGHRKGVIAQNEAGLVQYTLVDGEPLPGNASSNGAPERVYLPGGIVAPEGSTGSFALEDGSQGYAFFEAPGSSDTVADALKASLGRASYRVDERMQTELNAAREATPPGQNEAPGKKPVILSFQGKDRKGYVVVSPARPGTSRVTLALR